MHKTFSALQLLEPIQRAVSARGYNTPTPIQAQAIPHLLDGRDLLGIAQTGTGKTAAFALPILDFLAGDPMPRRPKLPTVLVLTPTRELAAQIGESFRVYGQHVDVRHAVIFGGVGQTPQVQLLRRGIDVLVATPGRLLDLMSQGHVALSDIEIFVLDEADRMLDMGFIHDVKKVIAKLPTERQTLLFSATMPKDIVELAGSILENPVRVEVTPPATTVERIAQSVMLVEKDDKRDLLSAVLEDRTIDRVLVFTRTKHGADRVVRHLKKQREAAEAIHGNKSQGARERALEGFKSGKLRVLVATDIAARGIDVPDITHVINFDLPNVPEAYVHRIGRTARAGRDGIAISFCDLSEREYLRDIEKAIRREVPIVEDHPFRSKQAFTRQPQRAKTPTGKAPQSGKSRGEGGRDGGSGRKRGRGRRRYRGRTARTGNPAASNSSRSPALS
ncbi:MAG: DEAD/DEAH box helicase [Planctomycetes bacterium]|nr:DEAD/DEAH box helicase [Planctomycetota bacterium]